MKNNNTVEYAEIGHKYFFEAVTNVESNSPKAHFHNEYEIFLLTKGNRDYIINGKFCSPTLSSVVFIPPGLVHVTTGGPFDRKLIHFSKSLLTDVFNEKYISDLLNTVNSGLISFDEQTTQKVYLYFQELENSYQTKNPEMFCTYTVLLLQLLKGAVSTSIAPPDSLTNKIVSYLTNNYGQNITLESLSKVFYANKYYLCHIFYNDMQIPIIKYLNQIRIERAAEMLKQSKRSLTDIAFSCGFKDAYYFSKKFKNEIGVSPMNYRKIFK